MPARGERKPMRQTFAGCWASAAEGAASKTTQIAKINPRRFATSFLGHSNCAKQYSWSLRSSIRQRRETGVAFGWVGRSLSLDHAVCARQHALRDLEADLLRRFEVDDELELGGLHYREIGWLCSLQYPVDVGGRPSVLLDQIC